VWEHTPGDTHEDGLEVTGAISHTLIDEKLSIGAETMLAIATEDGSRSRSTENLRLGPSLQWRPTNQWHVDFTPLIGLTEDSREFEVYLIIGYEF